MFSDESALVKVKDEKIAELTQVQEKNQFAEIDQWIAEHGDELPFDSPEANQLAGYIEITPPVDMSSLKADQPLAITVEESVTTILPAFPTISDLSYVSILSIFSFQKSIPNPRAIATTTIAIITYCILTPLP